jgi:hypothetical protein
MLRIVTRRNTFCFAGHKNIMNGVPWRMAICFIKTLVNIFSLLPTRMQDQNLFIQVESSNQCNFCMCVCVCQYFMSNSLNDLILYIKQ